MRVYTTCSTASTLWKAFQKPKVTGKTICKRCNHWHSQTILNKSYTVLCFKITYTVNYTIIEHIAYHVSQTNRQFNRVKDQQIKRLTDWKTPRPVDRQWAMTGRHIYEQFILGNLWTKHKVSTCTVLRQYQTEVLNSTDWAQWGLYKKRPMTDILLVLSPGSLLVIDLVHNWKVQCAILKFNLAFSCFFFGILKRKEELVRITRKRKRICNGLINSLWKLSKPQNNQKIIKSGSEWSFRSVSNLILKSILEQSDWSIIVIGPLN